MDIITLFLTKLSEPLIKFANGFFSLLLKVDKWWTKKTDATKLNIRWMIFTALLISLGVARETQNTNANIVNYNRSVVNDRIRDSKIEKLEEWKINRLQGEIVELKEIRKNALENEKEIEKLNSKK